MARHLLTGYCLLIYAFLLLPILVVVGASFNAGAFLTFPPQGLSFRWYVVFFHNEVFLNAIKTSLWVAAVSTVISSIIGTMAAIFYVQHAGRWKESIRLAMLLPLLLPEVLTAISLLFFVYSIGMGTRTIAAMIIGHCLITLPFVFINVSAAMESYEPSWSLAAKSLGAGPLTRFRRIMLPLIKPGVIGGCLFAFIISFDTFTISFMLKNVGTATLPIQLYDYLRTNFTPEAAAVSTVSIVLTLFIVVLSEKVLGLRIHRF
ncbi:MULTISPECIES: ABC transporter permease [Rhizobium]|uniref:Putative spermidine/putrescine transport system permease protein n=1 Tax=Rhizobium lusitanum TaxID=293958 RepID=A0A1C3XFK2_9HYPH|nr:MULTISPECIES: ABC transporter permease [Rhizobium]NKJ07472.1 putative spermidine/putrescine transport system permease protein [Rhizobium sp. SG741]NKJ36640.1 putative spermidine/putrescine transport system permease protein [Rhizobium sp. SG570]NTJ09238.1 ABC transporter permease [Rhizobium lusitanum]SCB50754.1 putative spermidine/putrescine transport system permease protein [Rhizobium lusitanum]